MEQFTASNGYEAEPADGVLIVRNVAGHERHVLGRYTIEALREFFQHERDEELGRWRYPGDPRYVVRGGYSPGEQRRFARVLNEQIGIASVVYEGAKERSEVSDVAAAYFEAHPERKPWQRAQVGEVWVLSTADGETDAYTAMPVRGGGLAFEAPEGRYLLDDADIESARRIWPASDD